MEQLVAYCQPHQSKPASEKAMEYRKKYYETNKEKINNRAKEFSKKKYEDPEYREAVRVKNANYRLIMKQAKQIVLEKLSAEAPH
jgi:hypothetical protein